jgi:hypothetical protein
MRAPWPPTTNTSLLFQSAFSPLHDRIKSSKLRSSGPRQKMAGTVAVRGRVIATGRGDELATQAQVLRPVDVSLPLWHSAYGSSPSIHDI